MQPGPDLMPLLLDSRLRTTSYLEVLTTACEPVYYHTVTLGLFISSDADAPGPMPMMGKLKSIVLRPNCANDVACFLNIRLLRQP